jgi:hypothetical protein
VLSADGAAAAYRLPFLLAGGSLVLWVDSPRGFAEHLYEQFRPNVHYIPIKADLSNLIERIEWARAHDSEARAIALLIGPHNDGTN